MVRFLLKNSERLWAMVSYGKSRSCRQHVAWSSTCQFLWIFVFAYIWSVLCMYLWSLFDGMSNQCWSAWNELPHDKTNKMEYAPSKDSDQPGHPPSLIRVFAVCMKKAWVLRPTIKKILFAVSRPTQKNCPYPQKFIGLPEKDFFHFIFSDSVFLYFPSKMLRMCCST